MNISRLHRFVRKSREGHVGYVSLERNIHGIYMRFTHIKKNTIPQLFLTNLFGYVGGINP